MTVAIRPFMLVACLAWQAVAHAPGAFAQWELERVFPERMLGRGALSATVTAAGDPVLAYTATRLHVARFDGLSWQVDDLGALGCHDGASIASGPSGELIVAHVRRPEGRVQLARWTGTDWESELLPFSGDPGWLTSLAIGPGGGLLVGFVERSDSSVRVARWDGSSWAVESVGEAWSTAARPSVAFDSTGQGFVAHGGPGGELRLSRRLGGSWSSEPVDAVAGSARDPSLAFDAAGRPAISYSAGSPRVLQLARLDGSDWLLDIVDGRGPCGSHSSLRFDGLGRPLISHHAPGADELRLASWDGIGWSHETVTVLATAEPSTWLLPDAMGRWGIAHRDLESVRLESWDGTAWQSETVDAASPGRVRSHSLDVVGGVPAVALSDAVGPTLRYGTWDGSEWRFETAADLPSSGSEIDLAHDLAGAPWILWRDRVAGGLRATTRVGALWTTETVDARSQAGLQPFLLFDSVGRPHACYHDGLEVHHALREGGAWTVDRVAAGREPQLALDASDRPFISYHDGPIQPMLMLASGGPGAWVTEWVADIDWGDGDGSTVVVDSAGDPHLAYFEPTGGDLMYATRVAGTWHHEVIDPAVDPAAGDSKRIAIAPSGSLQVAYTKGSDAGDGELRHAQRFERGWVTTRVDAIGDDGGYYQREDFGFIDGKPAILHANSCQGWELRLARGPTAAKLLRGVVSELVGDWREGALPLTQANDDETPPFPLETLIGASSLDTAVPNEPLVLYRLLREGGLEAGNVLRVSKDSGSASLVIRH